MIFAKKKTDKKEKPKPTKEDLEITERELEALGISPENIDDGSMGEPDSSFVAENS